MLTFRIRVLYKYIDILNESNNFEEIHNDTLPFAGMTYKKTPYAFVNILASLLRIIFKLDARDLSAQFVIEKRFLSSPDIF